MVSPSIYVYYMYIVDEDDAKYSSWCWFEGQAWLYETSGTGTCIPLQNSTKLNGYGGCVNFVLALLS